jgi:hypothetical protein
VTGFKEDFLKGFNIEFDGLSLEGGNGLRGERTLEGELE